jgi:hypothetical protein
VHKSSRKVSSCLFFRIQKFNISFILNQIARKLNKLFLLEIIRQGKPNPEILPFSGQL